MIEMGDPLNELHHDIGQDSTQNNDENTAWNQSSGGESFDPDSTDYNDTMDYVPFSSRPETYIVPILFAIIFVIGILGNGTLIAIFMKHRTMRNVPNMYIVSLAVGDLFVILFCVPFTSTVYTVDSWPYGEFVCKFSEFIKDLSIGVSVFTLTALSADRYFAIADPMRKLHGRRATRITCITIAGIWLVSIGFALPSAIFSYVRDFSHQDPGRVFYVCYPFPPDHPFGDKYPQMMVMFHFLAYYAIPLFFIGYFYIIMARHLVLSTRNMPGESQGQAKQMQGRRKVAKMILSFVLIFALCFFPSHLFLLWFYFYPEAENGFNDFWHACRITGFCLSFINSCINPITLYCVSGTFRKQYNEHLFCWCCCRTDPRRTPQEAMLLRQAGFACGCSLTGVQQIHHGHTHTGAAGPGLALHANHLRTSHSPSQHHHHVHKKSFRGERDSAVNQQTKAIVVVGGKSASSPTTTNGNIHLNNAAPGSPWSRKNSSSTTPSGSDGGGGGGGGAIPLTHIVTSSQHKSSPRNKQLADENSC
ncbi:neuropeptide CCHamide-1 receptor isoform X2 [Folsomia candida]|uniref:neuropeptide CCHamide-1 receptor isoform X2 n=1 Tax=Folsomia candida TaxID=158441 RepID=UPI000B8FED36|nr:neuropeptide CCHamide-1 receptor isoform X2 [Folsomia candida]